MNSETPLHFFLECSNYNTIRQNLLNEVTPILSSKNLQYNNETLVQILLYGHIDLNQFDNKQILLASIKYISKSCQFDEGIK